MNVSQVVSDALHSWGWIVPVGTVVLAMLVWSYVGRGSRVGFRFLAGGLKAAGFAILGLCLLNPIITRTRPRPGSNLFLVVADNSRSLQLSDRNKSQTRGAAMRDRLQEQAPWLARLGQDFDVRRYVFDTGPRSVKTFAELTFEGEASAIGTSLSVLADRFRDQPVAGILLLTDGNSTGLNDGVDDGKRLPPVYPVAVGDDRGLVDLSVSKVAVTQTNFEAAPVTIAASVEGCSLSGKGVVVRVIDETGREVERRTVSDLVDGEPSVQRFLLRPDRSGVSFYTVRASLKGEEDLAAGPGKSEEATLANNSRIATVDRGGGPYRVLYVSGRPNWEFKFLRRALEEDDEVNLVGLVRVARREPKFTFLGRPGERTNPLFRGFGNQQDEQAEQYDQPVLIRLKTEDGEELRDGFPRSTAELYRYHAVILDDLESGFFSQDQLSLLQQFVSRRGGGFLMLGGNESFVEGKYQRTPVGEMLPVYLDRPANDEAADSHSLVLTREGWLQPWIRLRTNEEDERQRLAGMPEFRSLSYAGNIKPGASVLAQAKASDGSLLPALVVQQFGRGRAVALLIGDLWRWNLRRTDHQQSDLEKSWRQTVRWLISDVPARVDVETRRQPGAALPATQVVVRARDAQFEPLDNASVALHVTTPDGRELELAAESSERTPGQYEATFAPREAGTYRAVVTVTAADGSEVGRHEAGWAVEPQTDEFRTLSVNRPLLEQIAGATGGEMVDPGDLESFVSSLPNRKIPVVESWTYPLWHQWPVFLAAVTCLIGEWALRRWKGLP
jgi:uncharacterized membrane protein